MATTTIRYAVVSQLITLLRAHATLASVQILPGFPGDLIEAESIWVDSIDGTVDIPVMTGGRKQRQDDFEIPFEIRTACNSDTDTTFQRLIALMAAVEDVLANAPTLNGLDGLLSARITRERSTVALFREGHIGFGETVVSFESRLL